MFFQSIQNALQFIQFSHTLFALPFALAAMLMAAHGLPSLSILALILICLVSARTAAMAFNRFADWEIDRQNPRTAHRHTLMGRKRAFLPVVASSLAFLAGAWALNRLCFFLSPICLALIFFYSLTKRFTYGSHFFLGLALSAAPMGAWAATRGSLQELTPWILASAVLCWTFGFDLIYATQDTAFDRRRGLHSFSARFGNRASLRLAKVLHLLAWLILGGLGLHQAFGWKYGVGWLLIGAVLVFEHALTDEADAKKMNLAFFEANALVSLLFFLSVGLEISLA